MKSLEGKSDEELAWLYLRSADSSEDEIFLRALGILVKNGTPETISKLREVFLDPAVWEGQAIEQLSAPLKEYVAKLGPEAEAFRDKLLAVVKAEAATPREQEGADENYRKMMALQQAQQFKQLEQVLRPKTLANLLLEYVEAPGDEATALLDPLRLAAGENRNEAEKQLLQTAAKVKETDKRAQLLFLLMPGGLGGETSAKSPPPAPLDAATQAAAKELLADQSISHAFGRESCVSDQTGFGLVLPRLDPATQNASQELYQRAGSVATEWMRAAARAIVEGQPIPPVPTGPDLKPEEVAELARQWAGLNGEQVLAAVKALPPNRQVGLIGALATAAKWEEPFVRAQLTLVEVKLGPGTELRAAAARKGRAFDEKLRAELADSFREAALAGETLAATFTAAHPLAGLSLSVKKPEQKFKRGQFAQLSVPGLDGRPPVDAVVITVVRVMGRLEMGVEALTPLWKDAVITQSWAAANKLPTEPVKPSTPAPPSRVPRQDRRSDPAALAALLTRMDHGDAAVLALFQFVQFASPLAEDSEP